MAMFRESEPEGIPRPKRQISRISTLGLADDDTLTEWMADAYRRRVAADRAASEYEARKPNILAGVIKELSKNGQKPSDFSIRRAMEVHWTLNDLAKTHAWLRDEADSLNIAVQTQLALRAAIAAQNGQHG